MEVLLENILNIKGKLVYQKMFTEFGQRIDMRAKLEHYKNQYIALERKKNKSGIYKILHPDGTVYIELPTKITN